EEEEGADEQELQREQPGDEAADDQRKRQCPANERQAGRIDANARHRSLSYPRTFATKSRRLEEDEFFAFSRLRGDVVSAALGGAAGCLPCGPSTAACVS